MKKEYGKTLKMIKEIKQEIGKKNLVEMSAFIESNETFQWNIDICGIEK